jgi:hypothetical protein
LGYAAAFLDPAAGTLSPTELFASENVGALIEARS